MRAVVAVLFALAASLPTPTQGQPLSPEEQARFEEYLRRTQELGAKTAGRARREYKSPAFTTENGNMKISVEGDKHIYVKSGGEEFTMDDPSQATLNCLALGHKLGLEDVEAQNIADVRADLTEKDGELAGQIASLSGQVLGLEGELRGLEASQCYYYEHEYQGSDGKCKQLSAPCRGTEYEVTRASRTADRECQKLTTCKEDQYISKPATRYSDNVCADLSPECNLKAKTPTYEKEAPSATSDRVCAEVSPECDAEADPPLYEAAAPTRSSDRVCKIAPEECLPEWAPGEYVLATKTRSGYEVRNEYCHSGNAIGYDGSRQSYKAGKAGELSSGPGKSCYTIRHGHDITEDGAYWIYMDDPDRPVRIYCDMNMCGQDSRENWKDTCGCGGWTMIAKIPYASHCMNRQNKGHEWKDPSPKGNTQSLRDDGQCAFSAGYQRAAFTDMMLQSSRDGNRKKQNVAWRHADSKDRPVQRKSAYEMVKTCTRVNDGKVIVPEYKEPTENQLLKSVFDMDWRDCKGCSHNHRSRTRYYHDLCTYTGENENTYGWGFFQRDDQGGSTIIGCHTVGHAGSVIGFGGDCGGNCERNYNSDLSIRTDCISAWGFGAAYGGNTGGEGGYSIMGHWWGHGHTHMAHYGLAAFVRDVTEVELECMDDY